MTETPRETRESLIRQWYEKKLNRDELLRVLWGSKTINEETKKKIRKEILVNFYENFDKAKEDNAFQSADAMYRGMKANKNQLKKTSEKLEKKKEETKDDLQELDQEMLLIAETAMDIEDGSWRKRWKLKNAKTKWDELEKQKKKIVGEISDLEREKRELQSSLKEKETQYGQARAVLVNENQMRKKRKQLEEKQNKMKNETTLRGYKEKYFQLLNDREEYMKDLLSELRNSDLGISEEMKERLLKQVESDMKKEIEDLKGGDDIVKLADETEKWLQDNWKTVAKKILDLKLKIVKKEKKIKELEFKERKASTEEVLQIKEEEFEIKKQLLELKNEYESIKGEFIEKLRKYNGNKGIDSNILG